jgi:hypothetical protein
MPVDYAEPTKLQDFKVEIFEPGRDAPTLTKPANSPTYETAPSQLTVPNRDTGLGKPNNLPERQYSLRNDGQYRTVDVTPSTTAKPAPSKQNNQIPTKSAADDAVNQAVYYSGFFVTGVIDAINDDFVGERYEKLVGTGIAENLAYQVGKKSTKEAIDLINDGIKNSEKLLNDLWRNKPTFEIPQIKIPKFDLPELPDLEPPKFPEFKFPEISFPKPQPIPTPKTKPINPTFTPPPFDPNGYDLCGTIYLTIAFGWKLLGFIYDEKTSSFIPTRIPVGVEAVAAQYRQCFPQSAANATAKDIVDSADGTGSFAYYEISGVTIKQTVNQSIAVNHNCASLNPPFGKYHYPVYFIGSYDITIYENKPGVIPELLRKLTTSEFKPEVIKVQSSNKSKSCTYPILPPPPSPPPPPPPEDDCCRMGCCPKPTEIDYRLIKKIVDQTLKEQKFTIEVPICKCEFNKQTNKWMPKTDNVIMEVFATSQLQVNQIAQLHLENARQAADLCLARNTNALDILLEKIGAVHLPATVPKILTNRGKGTIQINSLAEFLAYTVRQMDALCGQYPIKIEIQDEDLTQEGNQKKEINLPNIAESLAEIFGLLMTIRAESDANLSATVRGLIEIGSTKQAALLAHDYAKGNAEYLGYKGKQVENKVPFAFNPGQEKLDAVLKESEVSVKGWENDDSEDLNTHLAPLLELAAMWKAQNFRNLGASDTLTKLKFLLTQGSLVAKNIDTVVKDNKPEPNPTPTDPTKKSEKPDWDTFLEEAEQGFIAKPGITDSTNPYSRPLARRPKIREIGEDTSDSNSENK